MRPLLAAITACLALLALPSGALARLVEIGFTKDPVAPSCPLRPCLAVSRTTGYQAKVGASRGLMTIPRKGRIVAWTISLGKPGKKQTAFFEDKLGGRAQAGISVLRPGKKLMGRLMGASPIYHLDPYFGTTVQFPLDRSIPVEKGWVLALSVPTWAPALAVGLGGDTSWRASRGKGKCDDTQTQTAQTLKQLSQYFCLYRTARLTYTATLVSDPVRNKPKKG
jgi:hypothetical protein